MFLFSSCMIAAFLLDLISAAEGSCVLLHSSASNKTEAEATVESFSSGALHLGLVSAMEGLGLRAKVFLQDMPLTEEYFLSKYNTSIHYNPGISVQVSVGADAQVILNHSNASLMVTVSDEGEVMIEANQETLSSCPNPPTPTPLPVSASSSPSASADVNPSQSASPGDEDYKFTSAGTFCSVSYLQPAPTL